MVAELSIAGGALARIARRGVDVAQSKMDQLRVDAAAYEASGPEMSVDPMELLPMLITAIVFILIIASVRYAVGDLVATIAMVESPTSTAIIEPRQHKSMNDLEDLPEKEPLMLQEELEEVDITIIKPQPVTTKITSTIKLLHSTGGYFSRWRGLPSSMVYHGLHALIVNLMGAAFGFEWYQNALNYLATSMFLVRFHMKWTHAMIAHPATSNSQSSISFKDCKRLILPTLVFATAQQAVFLVPMGLANVLGMFEPAPAPAVVGTHAHAHGCAGPMVLQAMQVFVILLFTLSLALCFLLPASITLTRMEATLLPEDQATIVPVERSSLVGELDMSTRKGRRALYVKAWRSVDRSVRVRVVKIYAKMVLCQVVFVIIGAHMMLAEAMAIGSDRLGLFLKSAAAQIKLAMIESQQVAGQ